MYSPAFWDTSALVPLCANQIFTARAMAHYKNFGLVVWWVTPVEIAAAFARLVRTNELTSSSLTKAKHMAGKLADEWLVIKPTDTVRDRAIDITSRFQLRSADSLQLAAALEWCSDNPQGRVFLSADMRLRQAASLSGFDAKTV
jgi:predicted nucleic acid-binding protein